PKRSETSSVEALPTSTLDHEDLALPLHSALRKSRARSRAVDEIPMIGHSTKATLVTEMTLFWAKLVWALGVVGWFAIRYPHARRSRRTPKLTGSDPARDRARLAFPLAGMSIIPGIYVLTGQPEFADYPFQPALVWAGAFAFALSLWL